MVAAAEQHPSSVSDSKTVMAGGYTVICPHTNTAWMDGVPREWFLEGDLKILAKCDAVVLLPGYAKSEGTMGEIKFAIENDIPVFENIDALDKWVQDDALDKWVQYS